MEYPRADWAEQDPEVWWQAVQQLSPEMMRVLPAGARLAGISVSGQTPLCVPVDETGQPLRKAILWLDRRATPQVTWLKQTLGEARCRAVSINRLDSYFGGVKWLWLRQAEPQIFARTWKILQANSYVLYKLCGRAVIDPAQAGLCSPCFNFAQRNWDAEICRAMGIALELLPEVQSAAQVIGEVSLEAARVTGLPAGTPLVCGGGDFACAALSAGLSGPGQAALMLGTAGNLLFPGVENTDARLLHTLHLTGEALPFGGVLAGGNLTWFASLFGQPDPAIFDLLNAEAARVPPGSAGLLFLPYLMGERTPIWDPDARGAFVGLSTRHTRGHLYRAVLEGVAFAFRQIAEIAGAPLTRITALDGGARSGLWLQILADVLQIPVSAGGETGGTGLGSAFLAALGVGHATSFADITRWTSASPPCDPQSSACQQYDQIYPVYTGLYNHLKADIASLTSLNA